MQIEPFENVYLFKHPNVARRSRRESKRHTETLGNHEKVLWAQQQVSKRRVKRDMIDLNDEKFSKRAENLAYRAVAYDDPRWDDQWYLVYKSLI